MVDEEGALFEDEEPVGAEIVEFELADPGETVEPVESELSKLSFLQRVAGVWKDLTDLQADEDKEWGVEKLLEIINSWSTDPPAIREPGVAVPMGMDQMKLFTAVERLQFTEEDVEQRVQYTLAQAEEMQERMLKAQTMTMQDRLVETLEYDINANQQAIAYLTAALSGESQLAHEIIYNEGCLLVHVLTSWFINYMVRRETLPMAVDQTELELVQEYFSRIGMETAKVGTLSNEEKTEMAQKILRRLHGDDGEEDLGDLLD